MVVAGEWAALWGAPTEPLPLAGAQRIVGDTDDNVVLASTPAALAALDVVSRVACAVGSVRVDGRAVATGFLLDDGRFVTCHHVIPSRAAAARSEVVFERYERGVTAERRVCEVDADSLRARPAVDVAVVTLRAPTGSLPVGLAVAEEVVGAGDAVAMIHRPGGGMALVSSRWKRVGLVVRRRAEVRYDLDTHNGSSGAPVFDRAWRVVAVHRDAGPVRGGGRVWYNHGALIQAVPP